MPDENLAKLIFASGVGHLLVLVASALVPFRLNWRTELSSLSRLHRQMYWTYGGYIVLSILAFGSISMLHAHELANRSGLARAFCLYVAVFWGIRSCLQFVFDAKTYLTAWWLRLGYHLLTLLFVGFTMIYAFAALL